MKKRGRETSMKKAKLEKKHITTFAGPQAEAILASMDDRKMWTYIDERPWLSDSEVLVRMTCKHTGMSVERKNTSLQVD
jgi:hypothetical protein